MAITATTTTASTIRITIGFLLRAGPRRARRAARLNVVERALVAGVGGVGNGRPMTPDRRTGRAPLRPLFEDVIERRVLSSACALVRRKRATVADAAHSCY